MTADSAVANRSQEELNAELFVLVNDLLREPATYTSEDALSKRLEVFNAAALHPTDEYDVAFAIQAISLPDAEVVIGRTKFAHFDEARLQGWAGDIAEGSIVREQLLGRTVGLVRVSAGSPDKAFELAGLEVDTSLTLLRAAMASSGAIAAMDDLFWQRRSRFRVAKNLADPTALNFSAMFFTVNGSKFLIGDFINALLSFVVIVAVVY